MGDDQREDETEGGCLHLQHMLAVAGGSIGQNSMAKILRRKLPMLQQQHKLQEEEVGKKREQLKSRSVLLKRHVEGGTR